MPTIQQLCGDARLLADEPRPSRPSARRVLLAVLQAVQHFYSRLENTGQAWSVKADYTLQVTPNTSDYLLSIDESYGKPLQVLTYYPVNPAWPQRYVEFFELSDMNFDWPWPVNIASYMYTDGTPNTAMRMGFYYKDDGSRWVRVLPQPQLAAQYLVTFASGDWASTAGLEQSPVLTQFHSLVETWAAQSFLPSCEWWEDQLLNQKHRQELMGTLKNDELRLADEFDRYCRSLVDDHMTQRLDAFSRENNGPWGGWY